MKDIEVMRKELETAKKIRGAGSFCGHTRCIEDHCPGKNESATVCFHWREHEWDAFISTREAELAEMEKAAEDIKAGDPVAQTLSGYVKVGEIHGAVGKAFDVYEKPCIETVSAESINPDRIPTLDDFALALIQGGFSISDPGYDNGESIKALFSRAAALKAESDRRRGE